MIERLIEILREARNKCDETKNCIDCVARDKGGECFWYLYAYYLLTEGVTVPPKKTSQEELWEKNMESLHCGAFGRVDNEECAETLLRYWKAQEQAGYPQASENVKYFEALIAERRKR